MRRQRHVFEVAHQLRDGCGKALPPQPLRPYGVDHLGLGIGGGGFAPDVRARPIHPRAIAHKHLVLFCRAARRDRLPVRDLLGVGKNLLHMVAGAEAEFLQSALERHCPRPAGLARCTWRGLDHFKAYIWSSVVAFNLALFARLKPI